MLAGMRLTAGIECGCLSSGVQAVKAMYVGCVDRRLRQTHTGKLTLTSGMRSHHALVGHMTHAWIKQSWEDDVVVLGTYISTACWLCPSMFMPAMDCSDSGSARPVPVWSILQMLCSALNNASGCKGCIHAWHIKLEAMFYGEVLS